MDADASSVDLSDRGAATVEDASSAATRLAPEKVTSVDRTRLETRNRTQMLRNNEEPPLALMLLLLLPLSWVDRVFPLLPLFCNEEVQVVEVMLSDFGYEGR